MILYKYFLKENKRDKYCNWQLIILPWSFKELAHCVPILFENINYNQLGTDYGLRFIVHLYCSSLYRGWETEKKSVIKIDRAAANGALSIDNKLFLFGLLHVATVKSNWISFVKRTLFFSLQTWRWRKQLNSTNDKSVNIQCKNTISHDNNG